MESENLFVQCYGQDEKYTGYPPPQVQIYGGIIFQDMV